MGFKAQRVKLFVLRSCDWYDGSVAGLCRIPALSDGVLVFDTLGWGPYKLTRLFGVSMLPIDAAIDERYLDDVALRFDEERGEWGGWRLPISWLIIAKFIDSDELVACTKLDEVLEVSKSEETLLLPREAREGTLDWELLFDKLEADE